MNKTELVAAMAKDTNLFANFFIDLFLVFHFDLVLEFPIRIRFWTTIRVHIGIIII